MPPRKATQVRQAEVQQAPLVPLVVTIEEAARLLCVQRAALYKLMNTGRIDYTDERPRRVFVDSIDRYLESIRVRGPVS